MRHLKYDGLCISLILLNDTMESVNGGQQHTILQITLISHVEGTIHFLFDLT